jgi:hypothetical protein
LAGNARTRISTPPLQQKQHILTIDKHKTLGKGKIRILITVPLEGSQRQNKTAPE